MIVHAQRKSGSVKLPCGVDDLGQRLIWAGSWGELKGSFGREADIFSETQHAPISKEKVL
jgi:hypothetical protein